MNFNEIVERQEELQQELQELQAARIAAAQSHENVSAGTDTENGMTIHLEIDYSSDDKDIISVQKGDTELKLTVEEFNEVNQFLAKYNDAIYSYMSSLHEAGKLTQAEEVE